MELTGPLLVDTGCVLAAVDRADVWHAGCAAVLEGHRGRLLMPVLAVSEVAYLLRRRVSVEAEIRFVGSVADGSMGVTSPEPQDWARIAELVARYRSLGTVDASVVATAERIGVTTIATVDRRHVGMVRPKHVAAFTLVP